MTGKPPFQQIAALLLALALAACDQTAVAPVAPVAEVSPPPVEEVPQQTAASATIRAYYGQVQASLLSQGLLRTDMGGPDTPFTDRQLADNFLKIALYDEYSGVRQGQLQSETPIRLRRWNQPVRVALLFGASVPQQKRATDTLRVSSYLARLARVTGHQIGLVDANPNFWVHVGSIDERAALGPQLAAELKDLTPSDILSVTAMDRDTYCQVLTQFDPATSAYSAAVAVIPSEHPDLLRLTCIHEELAQALGLPNDSNAARPSIFNDDEEFGLLTKHDELLLRILYDPRLRTGMTVEEATPIVQTIAAELVGGPV